MTGDARARLREGPMSSFQIMIVVITTALNMIDGFDVLAISFTAPLIAKEWGVPPQTLGFCFRRALRGWRSARSSCLRSRTLRAARGADCVHRDP